MKKLIMIAMVLTIILCGCQQSYERDTSPGRFEEISVEEMETKIKNKDSFVFVVTQSSCKGCQEFKAAMEEYLPEHHVVIYELNYSKLKGVERKKSLEKIQSYFPSMTETPSLYYVVDGKEVSQLESGEEGLTQKKFDVWVQRYHIDEKKSNEKK